MKLFDYDNPESFAYRLRRRRSHHLREMIERMASSRDGTCRILDVGGEDRYWLNIFGADWLRRNRVEIVLLNHTDEYVGRSPDPLIFSIVIGDGCALPYGDGAFDLAHANSVIEHVGERYRQRKFSEEIRRVARRYYVQTPARCFPIEAHTRFPWFQYLPAAARIWLFQHVSLASYPKVDAARARAFHEELRLLSHRQFALLFPEAMIWRERLFGLTKSYMAVSRPS
ncbi:MAG: methyltransferase domain-containing protein [Acetobacteraceae bacterium]|nr:methyltransferase domain-containing protein [Acetobacteraceae bacterium]